ncbi:multicopper oxidase domain-containing protein [Sulfurivirga sp.]|uniref:multicopper oxidase family protein n=1 Tax=Sulfurivirga sp. TaxID=2614236 RepID=UPI0025EAA24A|nr:multicopper oxidase domain-containing protein [Sulfurivirga sp.]
MKRRDLIKLLATGAVMPAASQAMSGMGPMMMGGPGGMMGARMHRTALTPVSGQPLPIPPLYEGDMKAGVRHYRLTIGEAELPLFADAITESWAVQVPGTALPFLGPTLVLNRGEQVALSWRNHLDTATTMHGHGMHVPGEADGGPHQLILPGMDWTARYRVEQPACANWYHPHRMGMTAEHVYRGLAGLLLIRDGSEEALNLPRTYGVDDIPLVVQDRVFDAAGQIHYRPTMHDVRRGWFGDVLLTNGAVSPVFTARAGLLRLRLLNGSNSEIWRFTLDDGSVMQVIAGDNGLIDRPMPVRSVMLSPGERAEVVLDLNGRAGQRLRLRVEGLIAGLRKDALRIEVGKRPAPVSQLPSSLTAPDPVPAPLAELPRRHFTLGGMMNLTINGASMDMDVINERVPQGRWEVWQVRNEGMGMMRMMGMHHNFHVHGGSFRLLARNGKAHFAPHERGLKDTVHLAPGDEATLLVRFRHAAPDSSPFMYHCHFLEHEDAGMMGQFTVA